MIWSQVRFLSGAHAASPKREKVWALANLAQLTTLRGENCAKNVQSGKRVVGDLADV